MNIRVEIFEEIQDKLNKNIDYREFCRSIFFHPGGKSLRLNFYGMNFLAKYLPCHVIEVLNKKQNKKTMPSKHYVFLGKYAKKPYYIGEHTITFFDEDAAFLFKLCDGDISNVKTVTD